MLTILHAAEAGIRRHGRDAYPHECCGALIGRDGLVTEALALPNATAEGPRRRFLVRPVDYRAAERRAAEREGELLGFYHSHPDGAARPSQVDLDHAWPAFAYVIVAVAKGEPGLMTSWRLRDDRSRFDEEAVVIETPRNDGPESADQEARQGPPGGVGQDGIGTGRRERRAATPDRNH